VLYYDKLTKVLTQLKEGDVVRVKTQERDKKWIKAKEEQQVYIGSYEVTPENRRAFRWNRRHLQKTPEEYTTPTSEVSAEPAVQPRRRTDSTSLPMGWQLWAGKQAGRSCLSSLPILYYIYILLTYSEQLTS